MGKEREDKSRKQDREVGGGGIGARHRKENEVRERSVEEPWDVRPKKQRRQAIRAKVFEEQIFFIFLTGVAGVGAAL